MTILRLAPGVPLLWRSTSALQVGYPPIAVFDPLPAIEERLLAALVRGVPRSALPAIGRCGSKRVDAFVDLVASALLPEPDEPPIAAVRVRSTNRVAITETLRALGLVHRDARTRASVGLIVADHVIPWSAYRGWMRADVPHVGVAFGHDSVTVSQLVVPGITACLRCADLHRTDEDPAWPVLAAQLLAVPARSSRDPLLRAEALGAAARIVRSAEWLGGLELHSDGRTSALRTRAHPDCACTTDLQLAILQPPAVRRRASGAAP
jgi:hypothetical protein